MELKEAIGILENHQLWRIGEIDDMKYTPRQITEAVDCVLAVFKPKSNTLASKYEGKYFKHQDSYAHEYSYAYCENVKSKDSVTITYVLKSKINICEKMPLSVLDNYIECSESEYMEALSKFKFKVKGL